MTHPEERLRVAVAEGFQPAGERRLIAEEEIKRIFRLFQDDKEATLVLEGGRKAVKEGESTNSTTKRYETLQRSESE